MVVSQIWVTERNKIQHHVEIRASKGMSGRKLKFIESTLVDKISITRARIVV
jgi:hypothetical protein